MRRLCSLLALVLACIVSSTASAQVPRLVAQQGHVYDVDIALMAPDGRTMATLGDDRWVVWETNSGRELMRLTPGIQDLELVGFATDGLYLVTRGGDGRLSLWDVRTGAIAEPEEPGGADINETLGAAPLAAALDIGPVMRVLQDGDNALVVTQLGTTEPPHRVPLGRSMDTVVEASFADQRYGFGAVFSDGEGQVWDSRTGKTVFRGATGLTALGAIDRAPDDSMVGLFGIRGEGEDRQIVALVMDTATGEALDTIVLEDLGDDTRMGMEFGPSGRYLRVPGYQIWDREQQMFLNKPETTIGTGFQNGRPVFLTSSWNGVTAPIDMVDAITGERVRRYDGRTMGAARASFSDIGQLALGSWERRSVVWDLRTGRESARSSSLDGWVLDAVASGDSLVSAGANGVVTLEVEGDVQARLDVPALGNNDILTRLSDLVQGRVVLEMADSLRVLDFDLQRAIATIERPGGGRRHAAFLPDGRVRLIVGGNVLDASDSTQVVMGEPDVTAFALSRSGRFMLGGSFAPDSSVVFRLRDVETGLDGAPLIGLADTLDAHSTSDIAIAPSGDHVMVASSTHGWLWDARSGVLVRRWTWPVISVNTFLEFSPDGQHLAVMSVDDIGVRIYDLETGAEEAVLVSFIDGTWAVITPDGRFDASNGGAVDGLHWVVGLETIDLDQLKERYYEPGLLAKLFGFNDEPLRQIEGIGAEDLGLHPTVETEQVGRGQFRIRLVNRGGGIGPVQVLLNGREVTADARPANADPWADGLDLDLDLSGHPFLSAEADNRVVVVTRNADGFLSSRGIEVGGLEVEDDDGTPPALWAVVVGAGDYAGNVLDLRFAAKDASDFGTALRVASEGLFGPESTHVTILAGGEGASVSDGLPTRAAILDALADVAASAQPDDLVVLYLAGHGTVTGGESGDFHYLTRDAVSADLSDPAVRQRVALSSDELTEALLDVPALKQLLILDTCHSGAAVSSLSEERTVPGSQIRALDRMKDRSGLYVIAGSAADAVAYETSRFGQGLLTYSLLLGMRGGALREGEYVDVGTLLNFAVDRVPELAQGIGGVQQPIVATPRGAQSFDVGRITAEDQARIPLASPRPLVVRARFQDDDAFFDGLGLTRRVNDALREVQARDASAPLVFVDAEAVEGAHVLVGRYRRAGESITVTARIFLRGEAVGDVEVAGEASDLDELVQRLLNAVTRQLEG
ncbi:MAG: caspase family protein [Bacteroidota bacterium]